MAPDPAGWTALVLTGGRSSRMGSDKAFALLDGRTLLEHVLAGIPADVPCIIVGPDPGSLPRSVVVAAEPVPGGGPVSGMAAGMPHVDTPVVVVVAVDMPFAGPVLARLAGELASSADDVDAVVTVDAAGRRQQLAAAYRTDGLLAALAALGEPRNRAVREIQELLTMVEVLVDDAASDALVDIDTPDDLAAARRRLRSSTSAGTGGRGTMDEWIEAAAQALGIPRDLDVATILDVARDAAHGVERPAAPVTTYLMGYAVASGLTFDEAAQRLGALAREWPPTA